TTKMHAAEMSATAEMSTAKMNAAAMPAAAEMSPRPAAKVSPAMGTGAGSRRQHRRQTEDSKSDVEFPHDNSPCAERHESAASWVHVLQRKAKRVVPIC